MCFGDFFSQSGDTGLGSPIGRTLGQYLPHSQSLEGGQAGGFIDQGEPPGWGCRLHTSVFLSATLPCFLNLSGKLSKLAFETFALRMKSPFLGHLRMWLPSLVGKWLEEARGEGDSTQFSLSLPRCLLFCNRVHRADWRQNNKSP